MKTNEYFALVRLRQILVRIDNDHARRIVEDINEKLNLKKF